MSADTMYRHRYGWRPGTQSVETVGDYVVEEMFGEDPDIDEVDFEDTEEYQEWAKQFEGKPGTVSTSEQAAGLIEIATNAFLAQAKKHLPRVHSYDVRGGKDKLGNLYAKVTLETTDPYGVLQRAATYALQAAGSHGVSVTTQQSKVPGQVVLVFSQGATPK